MDIKALRTENRLQRERIRCFDGFIDEVASLTDKQLKTARANYHTRKTTTHLEASWPNGQSVETVEFSPHEFFYRLLLKPEQEYVPFETHQEFVKAEMDCKWLREKNASTAYIVHSFNPCGRLPYGINAVNYSLAELFEKFEVVDDVTLECSPVGKLVEQ